MSNEPEWVGRRMTYKTRLEQKELDQGWAWLNVNGVVVACLRDISINGDYVTGILCKTPIGDTR